MTSFDALNRPSFVQSFNFSIPDFREHEIEVRYSEELSHINEALNYKPGWDSYDGKKPDKKSLSFSLELLSTFTKRLKELRLSSYHFPEFCLAPDGIMGIEWDYAKNSSLFARVYSSDKVECVWTKNNQKQPSKEISGEELKKICRENLEHDLPT